MAVQKWNKKSTTEDFCHGSVKGWKKGLRLS
jgi:hypothetical protein